MFGMKHGFWVFVATAVTIFGASACETDAYCFVCDQGGTGGVPVTPDSGTGGLIVINTGGAGGLATDAGDSGLACNPNPDLQSDPRNCGTCGNVCSIPGAFAGCVNGQCTFTGCAEGLVDANNDVTTDGCECTLTNGGVEACDAVDNDCDLLVDEDFDLANDVNNCGACNTPCADFANATEACIPAVNPAPGDPIGVCQVTCDTGYTSLNGVPTEIGCPYQCPVFPTVAEVCNGVDDNCDGSIDEGNPGAGVPCSDNCPIDPSDGLHKCRGVCVQGVTACTGLPPTSTTTSLICVGGGGSIGELCDNLDNDCDGSTDEIFDLQTDEFNCGQCGTQCAAGDVCLAGQCDYVCAAGTRDLDGLPGNRCEYTCPVFPTTTEQCDGIDQDCDGNADNVTGLGGACTTQQANDSCPTPNACVGTGNCGAYAISPNSGSCYGVCSSGGVLQCTGGLQACTFSNQRADELCNNLDDNCDGRIDEGFDKQSDPENCGSCGNDCTAPNAATIQCSAGVCGAIVTCSPGFADVNNNPADGCEYTCPVFPPVGETCDGVDNDCDGTKDDNVTGLGVSCTTGCPSPNSCVGTGTCTVPTSTQVNGCYGVCASDGVTSCSALGVTVCLHPARDITPPTEDCDGLDNNCDGRIDETFNKQTDANNCGVCGNVCNLPFASAEQCVAGGCQVVTCDAGRKNLDGNHANGCEYSCPVFPTTTETCNNVDDDCDGIVDNNPTGLGACQENCPGGVCTGICTAGTYVCQSGVKKCQGGGGAQLEVCNNADDDCDGTVDDGFVKATDPINCGTCGTVCNLPNTDINGCSASSCTVVSCDPGFGNNDNNQLNGCEYTCPVFPKATETCNGIDDDCDGLVDVNDPDMVTPANFCVTASICAGATPQCTRYPAVTGPYGWYCNYSADVDRTPSGGVSNVEIRCDGVDNNCNTQVDEAFPLKGKDCSVGQGICAGKTQYTCSSDGLGVTCNTSATAGNAVAEKCNGLDDNCDGQVDERTPTGGVVLAGWIEPMVKLGASNVWVAVYEASRPDATSTDSGLLETRACSDVDRLPWTSVNETEAQAACAAITNSAGQPMRLCTAAEWETACEAAENVTTTPLWSYASNPDTYAAGTCNDNDSSIAGDAWATGSGASCYAAWPSNARIYDLSGNVAEWTSTTASVSSVTYNRVRGGNYSTFPMGTRCDFNFVLEKPDYQNFDLGFRCCSDAAP